MKFNHQNAFFLSRSYLLAFISVFIFPVAAVAEIHVSHLRCEYMENPQGIDETAPRLGWILESDEKGQEQSAYQILVSDNQNTLDNDQGNLWDSGKVRSDQSIHIPYQGKKLQSRMECFWKVRVWDKDGDPSAWSSTANWSMGLLDESDWKAQWIGWDKQDSVVPLKQTKAVKQSHWIWFPYEKPGQSAPAESIYFRRSFGVPQHVQVAKAYFTADNQFTLWVNGTEVGNGNNFNQLVEIDLTEYLQKGQNVIAVAAVNAGDSPNPAGLIGLVQITLENEQSIIIHTDDQWKTSKSAEDNWQSINADESRWKNANAFALYGASPWGNVNLAGSEAQERRLPARYLRNEFNLDQPMERATIAICGLGLFELRVNGEKISDHVLQPALTEYDDRVFYLTFDVTDQLQKGENALGVILGNGRYYAPRLTVPTKTRTFGFPKLLLQLDIQHNDGSTSRVISNQDWKITTNGPVQANNEYDGEEYDARLEMPGWDQPNFDDSAWNNVEMVEAPEGTLRAQMTEPIRVTDTLLPVKRTNPRPGMYIFDMGQNMVGWCRLRVEGPKGTEVKLRHAEVIKEDGTLFLDNIRSAKVTDIYTLKGDGIEVFEPRFTYHGFRYVEVTGYPGVPDLTCIEGRVVHDDLDEVGSFECSNPLLNQIWKNIYWGVRGNYRSFPTDCPQRDERQAWLGDRAAESKGETYLFNVAPLYRKWMADINDAQREDGAVPSVAPSYWPMYPNDVTWPSCYLITPANLYDQYADLKVIEERYVSMKQWIDFMSGFLEDGIMPRDTYGDWCVPPESPELIHSQDPNRKTAKPVLGTTYFYNDLRLMARYANLLGKDKDADKFNALAKKIKNAYNQKFFDPQACRYDNGSQTSYVLPLAFGMVPKQYEEKVFNNLVDKIIHETNGHIGTGLIGGQWLMRVLSDHGRPDIAYTIATQKTYPSWGYMIENDATTIWELWNGDTANPAMNSHNHVMLVGDLNIWFMEYLVGIKSDPEKPAFKHIIMRPHPVKGLDYCKGDYRSMHGTIASHWKKDAGLFIWDIEIPVNTTATVCIPAQTAEDISINNKPLRRLEEIDIKQQNDKGVSVMLNSGSYHIESVFPKH